VELIVLVGMWEFENRMPKIIFGLCKERGMS
jgi:hypothetical protein